MADLFWQHEDIALNNFNLLIITEWGKAHNWPINYCSRVNTPFENPQRWMGQNTFPILLLNDDNMITLENKNENAVWMSF